MTVIANFNRLLLFFALAGIGACASYPPMPPVEKIDIDRFMGSWYVIANIPTRWEKNIVNAVETYTLVEDNVVETVFEYREGGVDGELKRMTPTGFITDHPSNALWGMQFVWPIKADYRIVYINSDYTQTIIGREKRDYVWIMARTPEIPERDFEKLASEVESLGYAIEDLQRVPQDWSQ